MIYDNFFNIQQKKYRRKIEKPLRDRKVHDVYGFEEKREPLYPIL